MKRHHPMPVLRNAFFSVTLALAAGVAAAPSFAQTDAPDGARGLFLRRPPNPRPLPLPLHPLPAPSRPRLLRPSRTAPRPARPRSPISRRGCLAQSSTSRPRRASRAARARAPCRLPQAPEGSPFQDFFDEFFKNRQGGGGGASRACSRWAPASSSTPPRASSSPTTTSSRTPTRSRSTSPTAPS